MIASLPEGIRGNQDAVAVNWAAGRMTVRSPHFAKASGLVAGETAPNVVQTTPERDELKENGTLQLLELCGFLAENLEPMGVTGLEQGPHSPDETGILPVSAHYGAHGAPDDDIAGLVEALSSLTPAARARLLAAVQATPTKVKAR
ncbi:MAG: hypothetical protein K8T25_18125 [Planctomycetia bacterium]|nr:hypothetical protein [Planctomycetia bacterium]